MGVYVKGICAILVFGGRRDYLPRVICGVLEGGGR